MLLALTTTQDIAKAVILILFIGVLGFLINLYGDWDDRQRFG